MSSVMNRLGLVLLLALPVVPAAGCGKTGQLPGLDTLQQFLPKISFQKLKVRDIDFTRVDTDFIFKIENQLPIGVKLSSFSYQLDLAGERFVNGNNSDGLALEARGDSKLVFPLGATFEDIIALAGGLKGKDDVPFAFKGKIGFNTPLGEVKVPFQEAGNFPVLQAPKISFKRIAAPKVDLLRQTATLQIDLGVTHNQGSKLDLSQFDYALELGGRKVVEGLVGKLASVEAGEEATVTIPVTLNLLQAGATIVQAITSKSKIDVGLDANLDVATPFGVIPLHIDETGNLKIQ